MSLPRIFRTLVVYYNLYLRVACSADADKEAEEFEAFSKALLLSVNLQITRSSDFDVDQTRKIVYKELSDIHADLLAGVDKSDLLNYLSAYSSLMFVVGCGESRYMIDELHALWFILQGSYSTAARMFVNLIERTLRSGDDCHTHNATSLFLPLWLFTRGSSISVVGNDSSNLTEWLESTGWFSSIRSTSADTVVCLDEDLFVTGVCSRIGTILLIVKTHVAPDGADISTSQRVQQHTGKSWYVLPQHTVYSSEYL